MAAQLSNGVRSVGLRRFEKRRRGKAVRRAWKVRGEVTTCIKGWAD
jgi:hypothetical protein